MKAKHHRYRSFHYDRCSCETEKVRSINRLRWIGADTLNYNANYYATYAKWGGTLLSRPSDGKVEVVCRQCEEQLAYFFPITDRDKEPTKVDQAMIGKQIEVERVVAWVGYATDPAVTFLTEGELQRRAADFLWAVLEKHFQPINGSCQDAALDVMKLLNSRGLQQESTEYRMGMRGLEELVKAATYNIRGQRMTSTRRRLWFQNRDPQPFTIKGVARCQTGRYDPGGYDYYDGGTSPGLWNQTHHSLYTCHSDTHWTNALVHPDDIGGDGTPLQLDLCSLADHRRQAD